MILLVNHRNNKTMNNSYNNKKVLKVIIQKSKIKINNS